MPTDAASNPVESIASQSIADRRVLRLALGTSLSLAFSQAMAWDLSFIAPIFTMFLLATPTPAPSLKMGVGLVVALLVPVLIGSYVLLPLFLHLHSVGVLLVALALYLAFYLTARGAPPAVGTLLTIGVTLNVAVGSVSVDAVSIVTTSVAFGAITGVVFAWIGHALLPDPLELRVATQPKEPPPKPPAHVARRKAFRSLVVVLPVAIFFLFSAASASYIVVMMKVAAMAQEAEAAGSKDAGRSLIQSTFWGGVAAIIGWQLLSVWPSLIFYTLLIAAAALIYGRRIFEGTALAANGAMWSYAFLTMILLLAPAVLDSMGGSAAGAAFWSRLILVGIAALYGSLAVTVFDAFFQPSSASSAPIRAGRS